MASAGDYVVADSIDVTDVVCPATFVKTKIALEELEQGGILEVRMNDGEALQSVPRSCKEEGHAVLGLADNGDGTYTMLVRKGEE